MKCFVFLTLWSACSWFICINLMNTGKLTQKNNLADADIDKDKKHHHLLDQLR